MSEKGMGFRPVADHRDAAYPIRLLLDPLRAAVFPQDVPDGQVKQYMIRRRWIQGSTGTCVEHGWRHCIEMAPIMQELRDKSTGQPYPQFGFYRRIILNDEWGDNDFEATAPNSALQSGTSVRAGAEQAVADGLIANYLWARRGSAVLDIRAWLLVIGPGVFGLPWMTGMMSRNSDGFVRATGNVEGGHCVAGKGWSDRIRVRGKILKRNGVTVRGVRFPQSWNEYDYAWISEDDLTKLMEDWGEFCAPTEQRVQPLQLEQP